MQSDFVIVFYLNSEDKVERFVTDQVQLSKKSVLNNKHIYTVHTYTDDRTQCTKYSEVTTNVGKY